jgi:hypothetical protein
VRLCLDEHYSPKIAERLREQGHDVVSVKERGELVALADRALLLRLTEERRALVTENAADFMPLVRELAAAGDEHFGVVFSSPRSMPRSRQTIGLFVDRLAEVLRKHPADDALRNRVFWISP